MHKVDLWIAIFIEILLISYSRYLGVSSWIIIAINGIFIIYRIAKIKYENQDERKYTQTKKRINKKNPTKEDTDEDNVRDIITYIYTEAIIGEETNLFKIYNKFCIDNTPNISDKQRMLYNFTKTQLKQKFFLLIAAKIYDIELIKNYDDEEIHIKSIELAKENKTEEIYKLAKTIELSKAVELITATIKLALIISSLNDEKKIAESIKLYNILLQKNIEEMTLLVDTFKDMSDLEIKRIVDLNNNKELKLEDIIKHVL